MNESRATRGSRKRSRVWLATGVAAIIAIPFLTHSSLASWNDAEWAHTSPVTTSSLDCGTAQEFSATAAGRQVSGTLLGTDLDTVAAVQGVRNAIDETPAETYSPPATAHDLDPGSTDTFTRATSLSVGVLPAPLIGVALPQIALGVPGFTLGTLAQYSQVTTTGTATGATGAVASESGIVSIGNYDSVSPPQHGALDLTDLLGSAITSTVTNAQLDIGAVSAISRIHGCDLLKESMWGTRSVDAVDRDYEIAGLVLKLDSPLLATLVGNVNSSVSALQGKLNSLQSTLSTGITAALNQVALDLGILSVSTAGTGVSVTAIPNVADSVSTLLDGIEDAEGILRLHPRDGKITVDLARLFGGTNGLNGQHPNSEFLITPEVLITITTRATDLLTSWQTQVVSALTVATSGTHVKIDVAAEIKAKVTILTLKVAQVTINIDANLGALHSNDSALIDTNVKVQLLGLDNPLLSGLLSSILGVLNPLQATLTAVIRSAVSGVFAIISDLDATLGAGVVPISAAVSDIFAALSPLLTVHVNVQPDQPSAPPGTGFIPETSTSTAEFKVTALRIGLLSAQLTSLDLATATAGPVSSPVR